MSKNLSEADIKEALIECFDSIDTDKSGHLDSKEVYSVLEEFNKLFLSEDKMTPAEIQSYVQSIIKGLDKNADNKISKEEFVGYFLPLFRK